MSRIDNTKLSEAEKNVGESAISIAAIHPWFVVLRAWHAWARVLAVLAVALILPLAGHAQTTSEGSIRGRVFDPSGAVISGIKISASSQNVAGSYSAIADESGYYRLINLPPG